MEFAGDLETHLTVATHQANASDALRRFADLHGLKYLHIMLDRGQTVSQPMLTRHARGGLSNELSIARDLARKLDTAGFAVTRIKVEAAPFNQDVPQTDGDVTGLEGNLYFEHHVKLLVGRDTDLTTLTQLASRHQAHLSRNALRVREDGQLERFVTQRCWSVGRATAEQRLDALRQELVSAGWMIVDIEAEFVIYDNNLEVDAGWITQGD